MILGANLTKSASQIGFLIVDAELQNIENSYLDGKLNSKEYLDKRMEWTEIKMVETQKNMLNKFSDLKNTIEKEPNFLSIKCSTLRFWALIVQILAIIVSAILLIFLYISLDKKHQISIENKYKKEIEKLKEENNKLKNK